jgi:hypothetical protein
MTGLGDSFAWPFQDRGWLGKMLLQGLIAVIPIVGWIALAGWMMLAIDNFRAGRRELPPAGFHLSRGVGIFFVYVIYTIVFGIPGGILTSLGNSNDAAGLVSLGNLVNLVLRLVLAFLAPAIILSTYRDGFGGGFEIGRIWQTATENATNSVLAGLVIFVAGIIGGLGFIVCLVGALFTIPYSTAITAGAVTWFEQQVSPRPATPPGAPV